MFAADVMLPGKSNITVTAWLNTQNRLSNKDRVAASPDYKINLRAELKIMRLQKRWTSSRSDLNEAPRKVRDVTNL